jgi:PTS system fructose-specific IIC component
MEEKKLGKTLYEAMMTGVGYMIPVVISGAIIMAIGSLIGGGAVSEAEGTFAYEIYQWGYMLFGMLNVVLGLYTAHRIGGRLAIAPGLVAGLVAKSTSAGFIGAVVGGFVAGFVADYLNKNLKVPKTLISAKAIVIVPVLSSAVLFPFMYYILVPIATFLIEGLTSILTAAQNLSPFLFGGILAVPVAVGMGSFPGWASFAVAMVILQTSGSYQGFTAMTMGGACCNLGLVFAILAAKKKWTMDERANITSLVAGWLVCITEMQIPYVMKDPKRLFPAVALGSFVGGGLIYALDVEVPSMHGGMLVAPLATNLPLYIVCVLATAITTALVAIILKPNLPPEESGIGLEEATAEAA